MVASRVANSPLLPALTTLRTMLDGLPDVLVNQRADLFERTRATVDLLYERITDNSAGRVISDQALANGHAWVQAITNELQNVVNQNNVGLLDNGNLTANVEAIATNLGWYPATVPTQTLSAQLDEAQRRLERMQELTIQQETLWREARDSQARLMAEALEAKTEGLQRLSEQEAAAAKLLAALGARGTSSGYKGTAEAEKAQADLWRRVAIGAGVLAALIGALLFVIIKNEDAASIAARAGVTVPWVLIAVYAGKQSSGHRAQQREARRLELSFGSVDAYLADLDPASRANLKTTLSSNLYRVGDLHGAVVGEDYPTSGDLVGLLRDAIKRLGR